METFSKKESAISRTAPVTVLSAKKTYRFRGLRSALHDQGERPDPWLKVPSSFKTAHKSVGMDDSVQLAHAKRAPKSPTIKKDKYANKN
jgi:hypothetical protein